MSCWKLDIKILPTNGQKLKSFGVGKLNFQKMMQFLELITERGQFP
jgi:hypothetical protein